MKVITTNSIRVQGGDSEPGPELTDVWLPESS